MNGLKKRTLCNRAHYRANPYVNLQVDPVRNLNFFLPLDTFQPFNLVFPFTKIDKFNLVLLA